MTVAAQTPEVSHEGNGSTTAFAVPFRYSAASDLRALVRDANGVETVLSYPGQFSASAGNTDAGGTLTAVSAPANGSTLVIWRETARVQTADYIETGPFTAEMHEEALDQSAMRDQEVDLILSRSPKFPRGVTGGTIEDPATGADKFLRLTADGGMQGVSLEALAVLLEPEKGAGTTVAFTELTGPRSQMVAFDPDGVGEGGYWIEFSAAEDTDFVRAYAKVFLGTGSCDIRVLAGENIIWSYVGLTSAAIDQTITETLDQYDDLIFVIENIVGDVRGVVVKLEGAAA